MNNILINNPVFTYEERTARMMGGKADKLRFDILADLAKKRGYELVEDTSPESVREIMELVGNKIGSVHFIKRGDGTLRKMSYRLHVTKPSVAKSPSGRTDRKTMDRLHDQMTVFDVNKVVRGINGEVIGRGAWRTVPLENVVRVAAAGKVYLLMPDYE